MKKGLFRALAFLSVFGAVPASYASGQNGTENLPVILPQASDFNAIIFGDFSSPWGSSITGRLAVGGNLNFNNYGMATQVSPDDIGISVLVGGDMAFASGKVYGGDILVGGSADQVGMPVRYGFGPEQSLLDHVKMPVNFSAIKENYSAQSSQLAALSLNGSYEVKWGGLYMKGDCHSETQVFALNGSELLNLNHLHLNCVPEKANIVLNISGKKAGLRNIGLEPFRQYADRLVMNFYQADTVYFTSVGLFGFVLAPQANIVNPTGSLRGMVVAASWNGPMNMVWVAYNGYGADAAVCDGPVAE